MIASLSTESIPLPGKHGNKPKGVYFLSAQVFGHIYGPVARAQIAQRVDLPEHPVTEALYESTNKTWPGVEMIFSGWGFTVMNENFLARFPRSENNLLRRRFHQALRHGCLLAKRHSYH